MAQESRLTAPLVVKDLHGGVVGQTGTVWTITPDRRFTVARQIGSHIAAPHKQGELTASEPERLAALIRQIGLTAVPRQSELGGTPQPNARQVVVSYGDRGCVLTLPPPQSPPHGGAIGPLSAAGEQGDIAAVRELTDALRHMLGG